MTGVPHLDTATRIATLGNKCAELTKYLPKTSSQIGAECTDLIFKELSKDESIPYMDRLYIVNNVKQIIKHSKNQRNIMEIADKYLSCAQNSSNNKIKSDWFDLFLEECKTISNEEIQEIWGKLLAEECINQNTRKDFLFLLKTMEQSTAEAFQKLNNYTCQIIGNNEIINNILCLYPNNLPDNSLSFDDLEELKDSKLINIKEMYSCGFQFSDCDYVIIKYFNHRFKIKLKDNKIFLGKVEYTSNGKTLSNIIERKEQKEYIDYLKSYVFNNYEIEEIIN